MTILGTLPCEAAADSRGSEAAKWDGERVKWGREEMGTESVDLVVMVHFWLPLPFSPQIERSWLRVWCRSEVTHCGAGGLWSDKGV